MLLEALRRELRTLAATATTLAEKLQHTDENTFTLARLLIELQAVIVRLKG